MGTRPCAEVSGRKERVFMLSLWNDWDGIRRGDFAGEFARALRAFDELRTGWDRSPGVPRGFADAPRFELSDQGDALTVRAELPGLSEKDVEVSVNAHTLTLRGERKVNAPEGYSVHRQERAAYHFERSYELPAKVDAEKARAVMKNGILTLTLPKVPEAQARQITVKAG
jgi:HSP20 family protein